MDLETAIIAQTERLILRVFEPSDAAELFTILGSRETMRLMPGGLLADDAAAASLIAERRCDHAMRGYSIWAVCRRIDDQLIGNCGFRRESDGSLELGYLIDHRHWRQGYAVEAASAAIGYAFHHLSAQSIVATIRPGNGPSIAVARRLGMHPIQSTSDRRGELLAYRLDLGK